MGVTIHFDGRLKSENDYRKCIEFVEGFARAEDWPIETVDESDILRKRVRNEEPWDYKGPIKGVILEAHGLAESVILEFDENLYLQEYVKTQFAPVEVHVKIVSLLQGVAGYFDHIQVEDEGEYWETGDIDILEQHRLNVQNIIQERIESGQYEGPFRMADGRIVDLVAKATDNE